MLCSSVWTRVPGATAAVMTDLIVLCCTLASICRTTWPPCWIRPRMGGLSCSSVPRPGAPASLRHRASRPFWPPPPAGPCARPRRRPRRSRWMPSHPAPPRPATSPPRFGDQPGAQLLRHDLRVRDGQAQLQGDLPVRKVQAHEVKAQHPHAQRLVVRGQHRVGEVVEAGRARLCTDSAGDAAACRRTRPGRPRNWRIQGSTHLAASDAAAPARNAWHRPSSPRG